MARIDHCARICAQRRNYSDTRPFAQQPAVHDLPLVLTSWSKIQERRSRLLQLKKEFIGVPRARCLGTDGLRLDPSVPLPDNQRLTACCFIQHRLSRMADYPTARMATFGQMIAKSLFPRGRMGRRPRRRNGTRERISGGDSEDACWTNTGFLLPAPTAKWIPVGARKRFKKLAAKLHAGTLGSGTTFDAEPSGRFTR